MRCKREAFSGAALRKASLGASSAAEEQQVVVEDLENEKNLFSGPTTTTPAAQQTASGPVRVDPATDRYGYVIRDSDLAAELLRTVEERLAADGRQLQTYLFGLSLSDGTLELGVLTQEALEEAQAQDELNLLEALQAICPAVKLSWKVVEHHPPPMPVPETWTREQCLRWMVEKGGLKNGADPAALDVFWADAKHVSPAELMAAARDFRSNANGFKAKDSPLAVFITPKVWKRRCPSLLNLLGSEEEAGYERRQLAAGSPSR